MLQKQDYLECAFVIIIAFIMIGGLGIAITYDAYAETSSIHRWFHNTAKWFAIDSGFDSNEKLIHHIILG